jgi:glycosyltransferase involved in cell wall biosynthesis
LYPGASEVADDAYSGHGIDERRILDGTNPATWIRVAGEVKAWQPDLLVFPAWTFFQAPALGWIARTLKSTGCERCALVHNVLDHEQKPWKEKLSVWCLGQADRYVTHANVLADQIRAYFPQAQVDVFPHPVFDNFPPPTHLLKREFALELLFYGLVRPYKGLDIALNALAICGRKDIRLTIAGEFWQDVSETQQLIQKLGLGDQVQLIPKHISDADTAELFELCDAVVLPYKSMTGSGIAATAFHYKRPLIASDLPAFGDLVEQFQAGWVFPSQDVEALASIFGSLDRSATTRASINAQRGAEFLTWERFAAKIISPESLTVS